MNEAVYTPQALNKAMLEAVDFIHAEGWDQGPTLFALVPTEMLVDTIDADIEDAARQAAVSSFRNAGQICTSPTRFYVQEGVYQTFLKTYLTPPS